MKRPPLKAGDVHPAHILRDKHGMNAANRPTIVVNPSEVPETLRPLIPYAERWAIPCDVTRADYLGQQPGKDVAAFWNELLPYVHAINQWLDSQAQDVSIWPKAAMHFLYLLKAHDEAYQPTEEEKQKHKKRNEVWARKQGRKQAVENAMDAFSRKDYAAIVELLSPFESELEKVTRAKLAFARKKLGGTG